MLKHNDERTMPVAFHAQIFESEIRRLPTTIPAFTDNLQNTKTEIHSQSKTHKKSQFKGFATRSKHPAVIHLFMFVVIKFSSEKTVEIETKKYK